MKALEILKNIKYDYSICDNNMVLDNNFTNILVDEAIAELEALENKDTEIMTREEARRLIDKYSKKDEFGVGVVSKKVAYIIADYLPKETQK